MVLQNTTPFLFWSPFLLILILVRPDSIGEEEKKQSKFWMMIMPASTQAVSSTLVSYAMSGSRTPPYLQALLTNFNIPIQFVTR